MTHTPGPWEIDDDTLDVVAPTIGDAPAYIACQPAYPAGRPLEEGEVRANVRLIAAAPELLAVLTWCADRWDKYDEDDAPELGQAIRDAIAKAEGRE
jgi:hypothetical protein